MIRKKKSAAPSFQIEPIDPLVDRFFVDALIERDVTTSKWEVYFPAELALSLVGDWGHHYSTPTNAKKGDIVRVWFTRNRDIR